MIKKIVILISILLIQFLEVYAMELYTKTVIHKPINSKVKQVYLIGTFNDWDRSSHKMIKQKDGTFKISLKLKQGKYLYKFFINNKIYLYDTKNPDKVSDGYGDFNSTFVIDENSQKYNFKNPLEKINNFTLFKESYVTQTGKNEFEFKIQTEKNLLNSISLHLNIEGKQKTKKLSKTGLSKDFYNCIVKNIDKNFTYHFKLSYKKQTFYLGKTGFFKTLKEIKKFEKDFSLTYFDVPESFKNSIYYQIFPDRFYYEELEKSSKKVTSWNTRPTYSNFFGGNIKGIIKKIKHLKKLHVDVLYLTPIFKSNANHRYSTDDYFEIDDLLGTEEDFINLVKTAKNNKISIVLDAVFNHTSDQFSAFKDVKALKHESSFFNWYNIRKFPLRTRLGRLNYETYSNTRSMPKLNLENEEVEKYLFDVITYWSVKGIKGWRVDSAEHMSDKFTSKLRKHIKNINNEMIYIGEIWRKAEEEVNKEMFDTVMNYQFKFNSADFFTGRLKANKFVDKMEELNFIYPYVTKSIMYNHISSHDTERAYTTMFEDASLFKLLVAFQFTYPGSPVIYYGDEVGMHGRNDPYNRKCFVWNENTWNKEIFDFYKKIISIRKNHKDLNSDNIEFVYFNNDNHTIAYKRGKHSLVIINAGDKEVSLNIDLSNFINAKEMKNLVISNELYKLKNSKLKVKIASKDFKILTKK